MANPFSRVKSFFSKVAKSVSESPLGKAIRGIGEKLGIIKPKPTFKIKPEVKPIRIPPPPKPPTPKPPKFKVTPEIKPLRIPPPRPPKPTPREFILKTPVKPQPPKRPKVTVSELITPVRAVPRPVTPKKFILLVAFCTELKDSQYPPKKIKVNTMKTDVVTDPSKLNERIANLRSQQCFEIAPYEFDHYPNKDDIEKALANFLYGVPF